MHQYDLLTKKDLIDFREALRDDMAEVINSRVSPAKEYLRNKDLESYLGLSASAIQNLRIKGILPFVKVSGVIYYKYADVIRMMEGNDLKEGNGR